MFVKNVFGSKNNKLGDQLWKYILMVTIFSLNKLEMYVKQL